MNANAESHSQLNLPSSTTPSMLEEVTLAWASATPLSSTETNSTLRFAPRKYPHTPEQIAKELRVDEDGNLWWKHNRKGRKTGKPVGVGTLTDYKNVRLDKHDYKAHTIIWCLYHNRWPLPGKVIDHINGIVTDNRKENLREVSNSDNMKNRKGLAAHNTTGAAGVCWVESRAKWLAHVKSNRKFINGGYYNSFEDAVAARRQLESRYGIVGCAIDTSCTSPKSKTLDSMSTFQNISL